MRRYFGRKNAAVFTYFSTISFILVLFSVRIEGIDTHCSCKLVKKKVNKEFEIEIIRETKTKFRREFRRPESSQMPEENIELRIEKLFNQSDIFRIDRIYTCCSW